MKEWSEIRCCNRGLMAFSLLKTAMRAYLFMSGCCFSILFRLYHKLWKCTSHELVWFTPVCFHRWSCQKMSFETQFTINIRLLWDQNSSQRLAFNSRCKRRCKSQNILMFVKVVLRQRVISSSLQHLMKCEIIFVTYSFSITESIFITIKLSLE